MMHCNSLILPPLVMRGLSLPEQPPDQVRRHTVPHIPVHIRSAVKMFPQSRQIPLQNAGVTPNDGHRPVRSSVVPLLEGDVIDEAALVEGLGISVVEVQMRPPLADEVKPVRRHPLRGESGPLRHHRLGRELQEGVELPPGQEGEALLVHALVLVREPARPALVGVEVGGHPSVDCDKDG